MAGAQQSVAGINTGPEDGILSAYEAMNLNLDNTQLVVLQRVRPDWEKFGMARVFTDSNER